MIFTCIILIGICTIVAIGTAAITHFAGERAHDGWFVLSGIGMVMLTIVIAILCNTTNWK